MSLEFPRVVARSYPQALLISVALVLGAAPAGAVDFQAINDLGIEYKNEVRVNASAMLVVGNLKRASYNFIESTVTINNTENKAKNLIVCVHGRSIRFDNAVRRTQIDMTFNAQNKSLSCALSQNQEMSRLRLGQMGCRQVMLAANQQGVAVPFVSGNRRTTIRMNNGMWEVNQLGPPQDGVKSADKLIAAGGAGAGGHPLISPNNAGGVRPRMNTAIASFVTKFMLSDDAGVTLATDPASFNCNKCFGMGSTLGDPDETRSDFVLNLPSAAIEAAAKLKVALRTDALRTILLAAGGRAEGPFELVNESSSPVLVSVAPTLLELPQACTASLTLPGPQPLSIPPHDAVQASIAFDCNSSLPANATADAIIGMTAAGTSTSLGATWIKARNADVCDVNADGQVDSDDIDLIMSFRNTPATGPDDVLDIDDDRSITVLDARACALRCTHPYCAK